MGGNSSESLSFWFQRLFLLPWSAWGVSSYRLIAMRGYRPDDGTAQFPPLFPWLTASLAGATGMPLLSLMLISSLAALLFLLAFERLT
ncbi:MAG: hypothetical protein K8R89_00325 [Anaerolineae bacterium]|nr:hypothetical protein [Anaerolineae bacterium]